MQIGFNARTPVAQNLRVVVQEHEVIAVAQIISAVQFMFDELIQAVQVDVGEELAVEIADGQALAGLRTE